MDSTVCCSLKMTSQEWYTRLYTQECLKADSEIFSTFNLDFELRVKDTCV